MEDRGGKLQGGANPSLVHLEQLKDGDGASQGFEAHKDPKLVGRSLGDVVDVGLPTEITCDCHS